eukprot:767790-Hanusia_phi.AAC.1
MQKAGGGGLAGGRRARRDVGEEADRVAHVEGRGLDDVGRDLATGVHRGMALDLIAFQVRRIRGEVSRAKGKEGRRGGRGALGERRKHLYRIQYADLRDMLVLSDRGHYPPNG